MKFSFIKLFGFAAATAVVSGALLPGVSAQASQDSKNNWRNLGIASVVIAGVGIANHDRTLTAIGLAGAAYSAQRYDDDRSNEGWGRWDRDRWHGDDRGWRRDDGDNRWHGDRDRDRGWDRDRDRDNRGWGGDNRDRGRDDRGWGGDNRDNRGWNGDGDHGDRGHRN